LAARAELLEVQGGGDERFAGAGRGVEDDVLPVEERENRLLLLRIKRESALLHRREKTLQDGVDRRAAGQGSERRRSRGGHVGFSRTVSRERDKGNVRARACAGRSSRVGSVA